MDDEDIMLWLWLRLWLMLPGVGERHALRRGLRNIPEEAIRALDQALAAWGGRFESETYAGAHHGWTATDNPAYNRQQADRAFDQLVDLFGQTLSNHAEPG